MISIHAPREGSDGEIDTWKSWYDGFQSTLPVRGATSENSTMFRTIKFQSTLPVRGATIYTHKDSGTLHKFQSTLPVRGATPLRLYRHWMV